MKRLLVLFVFIVGISNYSVACKCIRTYKERLKDNMKNSSAIFYAKVIDAERQWARVEVLKIYKNNGFVKDTLEVGDKNTISSCGFSFAKGEMALIYSDTYSGQFSVSLCSSTISVTIDDKLYKRIKQQQRRLKIIYKV